MYVDSTNIAYQLSAGHRVLGTSSAQLNFPAIRQLNSPAIRQQLLEVCSLHPSAVAISRTLRYSHQVGHSSLWIRLLGIWVNL